MLSEENMDDIIEDIQDNVTFKIGNYTIKTNVYRYGEGFDRTNPYVMVERLPASRSRFKSISNRIGNATENGQYPLFGYCQLEQITVYCYAGEFYNTINGRKIAYKMADILKVFAQRTWDQLLEGMYASIDRKEEAFILRDFSKYIGATKVYCFGFSLMIRTSEEWDEIPEDFEGEEIVENIGVFAKTPDDNGYYHVKYIKSDE